MSYALGRECIAGAAAAEDAPSVVGMRHCVAPVPRTLPRLTPKRPGQIPIPESRICKFPRPKPQPPRDVYFDVVRRPGGLIFDVAAVAAVFSVWCALLGQAARSRDKTLATRPRRDLVPRRRPPPRGPEGGDQLADIPYSVSPSSPYRWVPSSEPRSASVMVTRMTGSGGASPMGAGIHAAACPAAAHPPHADHAGFPGFLPMLPAAAAAPAGGPPAGPDARARAREGTGLLLHDGLLSAIVATSPAPPHRLL